MALEVSPWAALLLGLLYFFDETGLVGAAVLPVVAHELGHFLAIRSCGFRVLGLHLGVADLRMDYAGGADRGQELYILLAGPLLGLVYALAAARLGTSLGSSFWVISGGISLVLSLFNLLPALPLDGGRILYCLSGSMSLARGCTLVLGLAMLVLSLVLILRGWGLGMLLPGCAILGGGLRRQQ